jgi:ketosteroid isomerase-like protein
MQRRTSVIGCFAVVAGCVLAACVPPEPQDVSAEIEGASGEWMGAFAAGDAAALAALYTEEAMLLPPNSDVVAGTAAVQDFWQGLMDAGGAAVNLETVEATGIGDIAWEVGTYLVQDTAGATMDQGKYLVIWKSTDEGWRLHRDIWNSNMPLMVE